MAHDLKYLEAYDCACGARTHALRVFVSNQAQVGSLIYDAVGPCPLCLQWAVDPNKDLELCPNYSSQCASHFWVYWRSRPGPVTVLEVDQV